MFKPSTKDIQELSKNDDPLQVQIYIPKTFHVHDLQRRTFMDSQNAHYPDVTSLRHQTTSISESKRCTQVGGSPLLNSQKVGNRKQGSVAEVHARVSADCLFSAHKSETRLSLPPTHNSHHGWISRALDKIWELSVAQGGSDITTLL